MLAQILLSHRFLPVNRIYYIVIFPLVLLFVACAGRLELKPNNDLSCADSVSFERSIGETRSLTAPILYKGNLLVGTSDRWLYVLNSDNGKVTDKFWTDISMNHPPAIKDSFVIYSGEDIWNKLECVNSKTGRVIWHKSAYPVEAPLLTYDSLVVVVTRIGGLYGLKLSNGKTVFHHSLREPVSAPMVLSDNGLLIGSRMGTLWLLNPYTSETVGTVRLKGAIIGIAAAVDRAFILLEQGELHTIELNSMEIISTYRFENTVSTPPLVCDRSIVAMSDDGDIIAFDIDSLHRIWEYKLNGNAFAPPAIGDEKIAAISYDGELSILNAQTGKKTSSTKIDGHFTKRPLICKRRIYLSSENGKIIALTIGDNNAI